MDYAYLLVIQVLIDVADDIMRKYDPVSFTEEERNRWNETLEHIGEAHNAMLLSKLMMAADYTTDYYSYKKSVEQTLVDFLNEKGGVK